MERVRVHRNGVAEVGSVRHGGTSGATDQIKQSTNGDEIREKMGIVEDVEYTKHYE
jgi:hypothetical protein